MTHPQGADATERWLTEIGVAFELINLKIASIDRARSLRNQARHTHPLPATGARCAYHSPGRPGDICGRAPVAVYVNPRAKVRSTYRCATHDQGVNRAAAAEQGYLRQEVDRG